MSARVPRAMLLAGAMLVAVAAVRMRHQRHAAEADAWPLVHRAMQAMDRDAAVATSRLEAALQRPRLTWPQAIIRGDGYDEDRSASGQLRGLARLKVHRAERRHADGDTQGALRDLGDVLTFLDLWRGTTHSNDLATAAGATRAVVLSAARQMLVAEPRPSAAERGAWLAFSRRVEQESEVAAEQRFRYDGELERLADLLRELPVHGGRPASAAEAAAIVDWHRLVYADALAQVERPASERVPTHTRPPAFLAVDPAWHAVGMDEAPWALLWLADRERADRRLTVTAIALWLHTLDHGRAPKDVAEVIKAGGLPSLPIDPFDGQPLRYRPDRGVIYSIDTAKGAEVDDLVRVGVARLPFLGGEPASR